MFDINILLSWIQSINEWIQQLNVYIEKTDYFGLYILGEKWTILVKELENIQPEKPDDIINYKQFIKFIDHVEDMVSQLNKITNGIITKDVINHTISDMGVSYRETYNNIIKDVLRKKTESDEYLKVITDNISDYLKIILKTQKPEQLIEDYESSMPHGNTTMEIHITILKKYKKIDLLEPYKRMVLGIKKDEYINFNNMSVHPIQKINYLIEPFTKSTETKKGANISITYQAIEYDIMPLVSKIDATKFGPIASVTTGLNKPLIKRFRTIKLYNNVLNNPVPVETTTKALPIYTGATFKTVRPVNFKEGYEWKPMAGVDTKTYKYNELLQSVILKNMKIDTSIYKSFKAKDYQTIVPKDILTGNKKSVSEICYEELQKFLNRKMTTENTAITREMYLSQFFNISKIIENIKRGDEESIEIIPLTKALAVFKLI